MVHYKTLTAQVFERSHGLNPLSKYRTKYDSKDLKRALKKMVAAGVGNILNGDRVSFRSDEDLCKT